jgi:hypothetical protein
MTDQEMPDERDEFAKELRRVLRRAYIQIGQGSGRGQDEVGTRSGREQAEGAEQLMH